MLLGISPELYFVPPAQLLTCEAPKGSTATAERLTGDLSGALPDCPGTIWDAESIDVKRLGSRNVEPMCN